MTLVEFTMETATEALAEASEALRAAGVTGIWLDMTGAIWSGRYQIYVETAVTAPPAAPTRLDAGAKAAVGGALAALVLDARVTLNLQPLLSQDGSSVLSVNALVWPPAQRCRALEAQITAVQAQLAVWRRREQYDTWEPEPAGIARRCRQ
jgi:hypothetical protein